MSSQAFFQKVSEAESAYGSMDTAAFQNARSDARNMVVCLRDPLTPAQAAGFHRLEALGAFLARDHARVVLSLKALVAAAPGYQLTPSIVPEGHPLLMYFSIAEESPAISGAPLPALADGWAQVDGMAVTEWPVDRPYLYQELRPDGTVRLTTLQGAGKAPPGQAAGPAGGTRDGSGDAVLARRLSYASAGAALLAGGLYLGARASSGQFWDPSTPTADLEGLRRRTNVLGGLSAGLGVVAVGTGGAAIIAGTW